MYITKNQSLIHTIISNLPHERPLKITPLLTRVAKCQELGTAAGFKQSTDT